VLLAHDDVELPAPPLVQFAEPAVAVAVRIAFAVFLPEQPQRDVAVSTELLAD